MNGFSIQNNNFFLLPNFPCASFSNKIENWVKYNLLYEIFSVFFFDVSFMRKEIFIFFFIYFFLFVVLRFDDVPCSVMICHILKNTVQVSKENLTVWKRKFWQFEKENFDSLKRKFWQFGKGNFDSLKRKFWQFGKGNFDSLEKKILTVWKKKFWQFGKGIFGSFCDTLNFHSTSPTTCKHTKKIICVFYMNFSGLYK